MKIGIIGEGAIGRYVRDRLVEKGHEIGAILVRPERLEARIAEANGTHYVSTVCDLPADMDLMLDCAGHEALRTLGPDILRRGIDLITVSIGALADADVRRTLESAAGEGNAKLHLASGAIGALDCLKAASVGTLRTVTYVGRKPPGGWRGSPAEAKLDLDALSPGEHVHFHGSARDAATQYPKNANVAAAVALAGVGLDDTRVLLIADPGLDENVHEVLAVGDFGQFSFEIRGNALPDNPKSSALAAMSVVASLEREFERVGF